MTTVRVAKAEDIGDRKVSGCLIEVDGKIPTFANRGDFQTYFWIQGKTLADVLYASLPGATVDTLLIRLLELVRSELHVPYQQQEESHGAES